MTREQIISELSTIKHESLVADVVRKEPERGLDMLIDQLRDGNRVCVVSIVGERIVYLIENMLL